LIEGGVHPRPRSLSGRRLAVRLVAVGLLLGTPTPTYAHGGAPGLVVQPPIVAPGAIISVRGDNLWTDAAVRVTLLGASGERTPLAGGTTDGEAHLDLAVALPPDLAAGSYQVEVTNPTGDRVTANLVVDEASDVPLIAVLVATAALGLIGAWTLSSRARRGSAVARRR
jgi:hypothetical protein